MSLLPFPDLLDYVPITMDVGAHRKLRERLRGSLVATIGYFLSPLSWWNDLYVNIPVAYVLAWPIGLVDKRLFGPSLLVFYWITNLAGLLLLHKGLRAVAAEEAGALSVRKRFLVDLFLSLAYSGILLLLVYAGLVRFPGDYFNSTTAR